MNYYKNERTGEIIAHDPASDEIFALTPLSMEAVQSARKDKPNGGKGRPSTDRKCGNCGKKGHTAPRCNGTSSETQPLAAGVAGRFDKETFCKVVETFAANGSSQRTAEDLKLELAEVNRAIHFKKYGFYIRAPA